MVYLFGVVGAVLGGSREIDYTSPRVVWRYIARSKALLSLSSIVAESWETARLQKKVRETIS